jgi:hypothetical protein
MYLIFNPISGRTCVRSDSVIGVTLASTELCLHTTGGDIHLYYTTEEHALQVYTMWLNDFVGSQYLLYPTNAAK